MGKWVKVINRITSKCQCWRKLKKLPPRMNFLSTFFFSRHSPARPSPHLYRPLYLGLSSVTFPLHRHIRPFTIQWGSLPRDGALLPPLPSSPRSGGSGMVCAGSGKCGHQQTVQVSEDTYVMPVLVFFVQFAQSPDSRAYGHLVSF